MILILFLIKKYQLVFFYDKNSKILKVNAFEKISSIAEILYRNNLNELWMRFI
jgi:hypothetical protein